MKIITKNYTMNPEERNAVNRALSLSPMGECVKGDIAEAIAAGDVARVDYPADPSGTYSIQVMGIVCCDFPNGQPMTREAEELMARLMAELDALDEDLDALDDDDDDIDYSKLF
jgi:hypothetical protein